MSNFVKRLAHSPAHLHLGRAVRHLRRRRGISRRCLARDSDLRYRAIAAIERGRLDPTAELFVQLSIGLCIPVQKLALEIGNEEYLAEIGGERNLLANRVARQRRLLRPRRT